MVLKYWLFPHTAADLWPTGGLYSQLDALQIYTLKLWKVALTECSNVQEQLKHNNEGVKNHKDDYDNMEPMVMESMLHTTTPPERERGRETALCWFAIYFAYTVLLNQQLGAVIITTDNIHV